MKKIKGLDFNNMCYAYGEHPEYLKNELEDWFKREVEPINEMLENAVEVYGNLDMHYEEVTMKNFHYNDQKQREKCTHKALLINIEPIKKETAEDVLRDLLNEAERATNWQNCRVDLIDRIKTILGEYE